MKMIFNPYDYNSFKPYVVEEIKKYNDTEVAPLINYINEMNQRLNELNEKVNSLEQKLKKSEEK